MPSAVANLLVIITDCVVLVAVFLLRSQLPAGAVRAAYIVAVPLLVVLLSPLVARAIRRHIPWTPNRRRDQIAEISSIAVIGLAVSVGFLVVNIDLARKDIKNLIFLAVLPGWWWAIWSQFDRALRTPE